MPTRTKRQYTKAHAERIAAIHAKLHGVSEVVMYGDIAKGTPSELIQFLLVAEEEEFYQSFVLKMKEILELYGDDTTELAAKFDAAQLLWGDRWPHWDVYDEHDIDATHLDITVVPFNWQDRLPELSKNFMLTDLLIVSA